MWNTHAVPVILSSSWQLTYETADVPLLAKDNSTRRERTALHMRLCRRCIIVVLVTRRDERDSSPAPSVTVVLGLFISCALRRRRGLSNRGASSRWLCVGDVWVSAKPLGTVAPPEIADGSSLVVKASWAHRSADRSGVDR